MTDKNIDSIAAAELPDDIREARDECVRLGWIRMLDDDRFEITERESASFCYEWTRRKRSISEAHVQA